MANAVMTIDNLVQNASVRRRFEDVLGRNANSFIGSMVSLTNGSYQLKKCNPQTILSACMIAATLKLPINPSLGLAYVVPYGGQAQLQLGWRGYVQLAMRSGQYQRINVNEVYEGEIEGVDFITGDIKRGERKSDKIIGYVAYFRLINGFEKTLYMTVEEIEAHAKKYSSSYRSGRDSVWKNNPQAMSKKTVLKLLISRFGIMSVDMQSAELDLALKADQAVVKNSETQEFEYVDNQPDDVVEAEPPAEQPGKSQEQTDDDVLDAALGKSMEEMGM